MPTGDPLEPQVEALLGARLFEDRDVATMVMRPGEHRPRGKKKRRVSKKAAAVIITLAAFIAGGAVVVREGTLRRARARTTQLAESASNLLRTGSLESLAKVLPELERAAEAAGRRADFGDLILLSEATLYRHHDAERRRAERVRAALALGSPGAATAPAELLAFTSAGAKITATALLESRAGRLDHLTALAALADPSAAASDSEPTFLLYTALSRADLPLKADAALERAIETDPSYLGHLAAGVFDGKDREGRLTQAMRDVDERSAWTAIAEGLLMVRTGSRAEGLAALETVGGGQDRAPPVARHYLLLERASLAAAEGLAEDAASLTELALEAVAGEPPFLLDAIDRLLEGASPALARMAIEHPRFPRSTREGQGAEGRVLAAEGRLPAAIELLEKALAAGFQDPRAGRTLARAVRATNGASGRPSEVLSELAARWPENVDVEIELCEALALEGKKDSARDRLGRGVERLLRGGTEAQQARAVVLLNRLSAPETEDAAPKAAPAARIKRTPKGKVIKRGVRRASHGVRVAPKNRSANRAKAGDASVGALTARNGRKRPA